jgi:hypothetical protein
VLEGLRAGVDGPGQPRRGVVRRIDGELADGGELGVPGRLGGPPDLAERRGQHVAGLERPQRVEREDVGGPLPDRQHLGVAEQHREVGVLDVAGPTERLDRLGRARDGLLGR